MAAGRSSRVVIQRLSVKSGWDLIGRVSPNRRNGLDVPTRKPQTANCKPLTANPQLLVAQSRSLCNVVGPMEAPRLQLSLLPDVLAVCRLEPSDPIPDWATRTGFFSVSRTTDQLSIVCANSEVGDDVRASKGWRAMKIEGPLDLDLVGILVSVAVPLAHAGIGILPIGTFDTDYILVRDRQLPQAIKALRATGFHIVD